MEKGVQEKKDNQPRLDVEYSPGRRDVQATKYRNAVNCGFKENEKNVNRLESQRLRTGMG